MCHSGRKCSKSPGVFASWERIDKRLHGPVQRQKPNTTPRPEVWAAEVLALILCIIMLEKSIPDFSHDQFLATVVSPSGCPDYSKSGETTDSDLVPWDPNWEHWGLC